MYCGLLCTVAHNCHSKTKNHIANTQYLTAKPKTSQQKQNTSRQNQKPHGKTKDLTAKPNTSQQKPNTLRQKQIPTAKPKLILLLPWGILFLPWGFWFHREVFGFAVTVGGHHNYGYCDSYPRELFLGLLSLPCPFTNIMLQWLL